MYYYIIYILLNHRSVFSEISNFCSTHRTVLGIKVTYSNLNSSVFPLNSLYILYIATCCFLVHSSSKMSVVRPLRTQNSQHYALESSLSSSWLHQWKLLRLHIKAESTTVCLYPQILLSDCVINLWCCITCTLGVFLGGLSCQFLFFVFFLRSPQFAGETFTFCMSSPESLRSTVL